MSAEHRYYQPSGSFGMSGPPLMLAAAAGTGLALAALYGAFDYYDPLIFLNVIATFGAGFLVGLAVGMAAQWGHVRNPMLTGACGFLGGLVTIYGAWIGWLAGVSEGDLIALDPISMWIGISLTFEKFTLTIGKGGSSGIPVSGWGLVIFWVVEAGVILFFSTATAAGHLSDEAYCERCQRWIEVAGLQARAQVADAPALKLDLEKSNYAPLAGLLSVDPSAPEPTEVELRRRGGCSQAHYVTVRSVVRTKDEKGNESTNKTSIVDNLILDPAAFELLASGKAPEPASGG